MSNWAASTGINDGSCVSSWASFFGKMEALVLVAFTIVLVAAAGWISLSADNIFVAFTSWNLSWWTFWAFFWWTGSACWSSATFINVVCSDLIGTFFTLVGLASLLRAFDNT